MLTPRGCGLLLVALAQLAVGAAVAGRGSAALALFALTLLVWFAGRWVVFCIRSRFLIRRITVERTIGDGRPGALWAGSPVEIRIHLRLAGDSPLTLPLVAEDRLPFLAERIGGDPVAVGEIAPDNPLEWSYRVRARAAGRMRFEGIRLQLTDPYGLFAHRGFLRSPQEATVLPPLLEADGGSRLDKKHNLLPPPGVHRLRRPGSGSELLDLRDYRPGDPPKMIAWKPSARRDRLITKEFEGEVPVRCTLFLDASTAVRLGPPGQSSLDRLIELTSLVAQMALEDRDLVGLVVFDDRERRELVPARGREHRTRLLRMLADTAVPGPLTDVSADALLSAAAPTAEELYPDLLRPAINTTPLRMFWQPVMDGSMSRSIVALLLSPLIVVPIGALLSGSIGLPLLVAATVLPLVGIVAALLSGLSGFLPWRRRHRSRRKRLAAILAWKAGLGPTGVGLLLDDDRTFVHHAGRFLAEHHIPVPIPLFDSFGRYRFANPGRVKVLADGLARAVARGHDNELFVILADLLELGHDLDPVLRAVRTALARHHEVVVVCPWPPGLPPPEDGPQEALIDALPAHGDVIPLEAELRSLLVGKHHRAYRTLRREFGRLGVSVVRADVSDTPERVRRRLDRLRNIGRVR